MLDRLEDFGEALLDPARPVPHGVVGPDGKPSARRFAIYRNNVVVSLIDALAAAYPVVQRLVGEEFFRAMARVFAAKAPTASPIMLRYGEGFAEFVERFPPAASVPYLADVARLERAWAEAYHAAEAQALGSNDFAEVDPRDFAAARLRLHPSTRLVKSSFPVVSIWHMNMPGGVPAPIDLTFSESALVIRPQADVEVRVLAHDSALFVDALAAGKTPSEATVAALRVNPRFDLGGNIADVIGLGLVVGWSMVDARSRGGLHVSSSA